jgi:hypothetical protein
MGLRIIALAGPGVALLLLVSTLALAYRARRVSWVRCIVVLAAGCRAIATSQGAAFLGALVALAMIHGRLDNTAIRAIQDGYVSGLRSFATLSVFSWSAALALAVRGLVNGARPASWHLRFREIAVGGIVILSLWQLDKYLDDAVQRELGDIMAGISRIEFVAQKLPIPARAVETLTVRHLDVGQPREEPIGLVLDALGGVSSWPLRSRNRGSQRLALPAPLSTMGLYPGGGCGLALDSHGVCWADPEIRVVSAAGEPLAVQQPEEGKRLRGIETTHGCSANRGRICALRDDGRALCWNVDDLFQLKDAWTLGTDVAAMTTAFGCGGCVAREDGAVRCSMKPAAEGRAIDGPVDGVRNVVSMDSDLDRACAIQGDGALLCWELGMSAKQAWMRGSGELAFQAHRVLEGVQVKQVSVSSGHSCAVAVSGKLFCWGLNDWGQLGDGTTENRLLPVETKGIDAVERVSVGASVTCAVHGGGGISCWGMRRRFND